MRLSCKQKICQFGRGKVCLVFLKGPPREFERKAVRNVIIGLLCAELPFFFLQP